MIKVKALSTKGAFSVWAVTQGIAASDDSKIGSAIPVIPELPFREFPIAVRLATGFW